MEDDFKSVVVGICHNFLVELHGLLLVGTDEVNLQTLHTSLLQPSHLLVTLNHQMEFATRSLRCIVPITIGVVPKIYAHILRACILHEFLHTIVANIGIPKGIDKDVFPT